MNDDEEDETEFCSALALYGFNASQNEDLEF